MTGKSPRSRDFFAEEVMCYVFQGLSVEGEVPAERSPRLAAGVRRVVSSSADRSPRRNRETFMNSIVRTLALLLLILPTGALASTSVTLTFDDLADRQPVGRGYCAIGLVSPNGVAYQRSITDQVEAGGSVVGHAETKFKPKRDDPIVFQFTGPVSQATLRALDVQRSGFEMTAYDAVTGGNVLDVESIKGSERDGEVTFDFTLDGPGIRRIEAHQERDDINPDASSVDYLRYDITLPEFRTVDVRALALRGEQAPGAAPGVVFRNFKKIRELSNQGRLVLPASLEGPGVVAGENATGLWLGTSQGLQLIAREGDQAPGLADGVVFGKLREGRVVSDDDGGLVLFHAELRGPGVDASNDSSYWIGQPGNLRLLVRSGDRVPGTAEGTYFSANLKVRTTNGNGVIGLSSRFVGPAVTTANDDALLVADDRGIRVLAREGEPAPGFAEPAEWAVSLSGSQDGFLVDENGVFTVLSFYRGGGASGAFGRAIWSGPEGGLQVRLAAGEPAPGAGDGAVFHTGFELRDVNIAGQVVVVGRARRTDGTLVAGLWRLDGGTPQLWVLAGQPIPGVDDDVTVDFGKPLGGGAQLDDTGTIVLALRGRLNAYGPASLQGPDVTEENDSAVLHGTPGDIRIVAREGDPVDGTPCLNLLDRIGFGGPITFTPQGELAFSANLDAPYGFGSTAGVLGAVFAGEAGRVAPVVGPGDGLRLTDGRLLQSLALQNNLTRANDAGQIVFGGSYGTDGNFMPTGRGVFLIGANSAGPPVADAGPDATVDEFASVTLDGTNSVDPDGAALSFEWQQIAGPEVTLLDTTTATPTVIAPPVDANATATFELVVRAGSRESLADSVDVTIVNANHPPVADAGDDFSIKPGATARLDGSFSFDPESDPISYHWTQVEGATVLLSGADRAQPTFVVPDVVGETLVFELVVDDGRETGSPDTVTVSVVPNAAPIADAGEDATRDEATLVQLDGTESFDPDGDNLTFAWRQVAGTSVDIAGADTAVPSFTAPLVGAGGASLVFELTVRDDDPLNPKSATDEVVASILNANDPPRCDLGRPSSAALWPPNHKLVSVSIEGITDPDDDDGVSVRVLGISQDEPVEGTGDGDTAPDAVVQSSSDGQSVLLRAERSGMGDGRVYRVAFEASDGLEACSGEVLVGVPKSRREEAIDSGPLIDSTGQDGG